MVEKLEQGKYHDMNTRVNGGPTVRRDVMVKEAYRIEKHRGELYRDEIRELAELAGFTVTDTEDYE